MPEISPTPYAGISRIRFEGLRSHSQRRGGAPLSMLRCYTNPCGRAIDAAGWEVGLGQGAV